MIRRFILLAASLALVAAAPAEPRWVASWASSQQVPEPHNALAPEDLKDATLRQVVRLSAAGRTIRVRLSNVFGTAPLAISGATIARSADPASSRIRPETLRPLRFAGREAIVIPAGGEYVSDPVELDSPVLSHVTVTMHLPQPPERQTSHPGSRATSYLLPGKHLAAHELTGAKTTVHWFQLAGVDVEADSGDCAIVTLGDSITDGYGVKPDTDSRWPDFLAQRLQANPATRRFSVVNHGIGGGRLLLDGLGPNAVARFDRDVLGQPGVCAVVMLIGVNDLGTSTRDAPIGEAEHKALVERMLIAYAELVRRARERGIKAIGATILPYGGNDYYHPDAANEADRQAINAWIRAPGNFDVVIDFDALIRDPARPDRMRPEYDSGDHLHPSIAGYRAMAEFVPLTIFERK